MTHNKPRCAEISVVSENQKAHVLLVDDQPANIHILVEALQDEHRLSIATSGADALKIARMTDMPDLILLDVLMPDMDGFAVCQLLKEDAKTRDIPVIFLTSLDQTEYESRGLLLGAADYITKPFNLDLVRLRTNNHLLLKKQRDLLQEQKSALAKGVETLEMLNAELQSFNQTVSHDLRTPIRALAGFSDLLEKHLGNHLDDKGRQYLSAIRTASRRMSEITTSLLHFSRLGRVEIAKTEINLSALISKVQEDLAVMTEGRKVQWQIMPLPVVTGDANLLRIALTNLLANALKFTKLHEEAVIRVEATTGEDGIAIVTVKDNGVGFDMRYADQLFKVFSRLHPPEMFEGTGIGLATVSRIVKRHGGTIWAQGSPGAGAAFSFTLAPSPLTPGIRQSHQIEGYDENVLAYSRGGDF